jgi:hypothetical protein
VKYFIISQPKAGTYLGANLLKEFNINFPGLHFDLHKYQRYNLNDLEKSRLNRKRYTHKLPLSDSLQLLDDGDLGVGHLEYSSEVELLLKDFKKVLLVRNIDDATKSWKEWAVRVKKSADSKNISKEFRNNIAQWKDKDNVFVLDFDDMKNKNIAVIDSLQYFLFNSISFNSSKCITRALNTESLTKSTRRK